jgi:hypothetical protein
MMNQQVCPECRNVFVPYNNRKNIVFCGYACAHKHTVRQNRETRHANMRMENILCKQCKQKFVPTRSNQVFCTPQCRDAFKESKRILSGVNSVKPIVCEICGNAFFPENKNAKKYCSRQCRHKARQNKQAERYKENPKPFSDYAKGYRKKNNRSVRNYRLKNWYGISIDDYENMLKSQDGKCAICKEPLESTKRQNLDHRHSGDFAIRGILCPGCNHGLGNFKDSPDLLEKAIAYLKR